MAAIGGSIQEVTLSGRTFVVAADAEVQRTLGGAENEIQANGDGHTARMIKTRKPWALTGLVIEVDDSRGDHEFLRDLANGSDYFPVSITYASGLTYQGKGQISDTLESSSQNATVSVSLMGPGELTIQS